MKTFLVSLSAVAATLLFTSCGAMPMGYGNQCYQPVVRQPAPQRQMMAPPMMGGQRPPMVSGYQQQGYGGQGSYYPPQNVGGYNNYPSNMYGGQGYRVPPPNHTPWRGYAPAGQLNIWPGGGGYNY